MRWYPAMRMCPAMWRGRACLTAIFRMKPPHVKLIVDDDIDFDAYLRRPKESANVRMASEYTQKIIDSIYGDNELKGLYLPWSKTATRVRIRLGELTVHTGVNGHGKSIALNLLLLAFMAQGQKAVICSFEMPVVRTLERMVRQWVGVSQPTVEYICKFSDWLDKKLWVYAQTGNLRSDRMVAVARYCIEELGIQHIVIDSLMKMSDIADDDYNAQKKFTDTLQNLAKDMNSHIHLVTHSRKGDESRPMSKFDVKGSSAITDLADNVFIWWKNKKKLDQIDAGNLSDEDKRKPDAMLVVDKQRNGEWEGKIPLWYHKPSFQLLGGYSNHYMNDQDWCDKRWT